METTTILCICIIILLLFVLTDTPRDAGKCCLRSDSKKARENKREMVEKLIQAEKLRKEKASCGDKPMGTQDTRLPHSGFVQSGDTQYISIEDCQWLVSNRDRLAREYGDNYLVVRNKEIVGVYPDVRSLVHDAAQNFPFDDLCVHHCNRGE